MLSMVLPRIYILYNSSQQRMMNEPLQEVTNVAANRSEHKCKAKRKAIELPGIEEYLATSVSALDFGDSVCGSVQQRKLGIIMRNNLQSAAIISMHIIFEDHSLTELPQFIFGIRKETSYEYFDEFKFKAMQKGVYNFVVGVKTPFLPNCAIKAWLEISFEGAKDAIKVMLSQVAKLPEVKCSRELMNQEGTRMIKMGIVRNKSKKEVKLAFKSTENLTFTLLTQLVGLEEQGSNEVEVKPKSIAVNGKGAFILTFVTNCPPSSENSITCIRRILIMRVKDTKIHFHFPIEVMFYPGGSAEPVVQ